MCGPRATTRACRPPPTPGTQPFYYDKGLPIEKALHPDTILAWAQNGQLLEHLHGAPVRLLVPGWSGNWSVKWLNKLELHGDASRTAGTTTSSTITAIRPTTRTKS